MTITQQMIKQFAEAKTKLSQILINKKNKNQVTIGIENAQFLCDEIYNRLLEMVSRDTPRMIEENMRGLKNSMQYSIANVLANNQIGDLVKAILNAQRVTTYVVGRLNDDAFRNLTLEQVAIINSGGFTIPMAQKFLKETLEQEKIPCFVDKLGRTWDLDAYSNMAIRTGSRQSRNAGMLTADDHDLYYVVPIGSTCPVCAVLEGRVYSKSGTNPHYPPLTELYGKIDEAGPNDLTNSYLTIHPNCRHTLVKWNEDTKTEEEIKEMRDKSSFAKHPKNINPQTQKEMEEYRASQREKARFRGMLNEYHEMQAQGIDVPKNFQTFINNKEHNTIKYQIWKGTYKEPSVESVMSPSHNVILRQAQVVNGKNYVGKIEYQGKTVLTRGGSPDDLYAIDEIVEKQGFNGLPTVIDNEEDFKKLVDADTLLGERTIRADSQEQLESYCNDLLNDKFYINCATGGAQYGQGMYFAGDYTKGKIGAVRWQHEIEQYTMGSRYAKTYWLTLDKDIKKIEIDKVFDEYMKQVIKNSPDMPEKVKRIFELDMIKKPTIEQMREKIDLAKDATAIEEYNRLLRKYIDMDRGVMASEMGYDMIEAKGHGTTGSYNVLLNRTKLIIIDKDIMSTSIQKLFGG